METSVVRSRSRSSSPRARSRSRSPIGTSAIRSRSRSRSRSPSTRRRSRSSSPRTRSRSPSPFSTRRRSRSRSRSPTKTSRSPARRPSGLDALGRRRRVVGGDYISVNVPSACYINPSTHRAAVGLGNPRVNRIKTAKPPPQLTTKEQSDYWNSLESHPRNESYRKKHLPLNVQRYNLKKKKN